VRLNRGNALLFFALLSLLSLSQVTITHAQARIYYVSSQNPQANDDNDGTLERPWRTLAKVQSMIPALQSGDQVLFERGSYFSEVMYWELLQATPDNPIVFGAYGSGENPVVSGLETLQNWQALGDNRWQSACNACLAPNLLLWNGQTQALARYPNADDEDGYLYFDDARERRVLVDDALNGMDWTGGELVVRSIAWVLDRLPITTHIGNTLTSDTPANYDLEIGYGYFIQNHPSALDKNGEWIYDAQSKTVTVYWDNPQTIVAQNIQIAVQDTLWFADNSAYVHLQDLILEGANERVLGVNNCTHVKIERVIIRNGGAQGFYANNCDGLVLSDSTIVDQLNHGAEFNTCRNCHIHHNTIKHIALLAGMGKSGDGQYNGVTLDGDKTVFEHNRIEYVGYIGLNFGGDVIIQSNIIQHFTQVKVDGSGIYCWRNMGGKILNNIVMFADGSTAGTPLDSVSAHGIYMDDNSSDVEIRGNTVGYVGAAGIFLHNTQRIRVTDNTIFANGEAGILLGDDDLGEFNVEDSLISDNWVLAIKPETNVIHIYVTNSVAPFMQAVGILNNNRYCNPFTSQSFRLSYRDEAMQWHTDWYNFADWQAFAQQDGDSGFCQAPVLP
jgi:parallel beta-helix repeat protein